VVLDILENRGMGNIIYLGIPYTWNPQKSFEIVNKAAAKLMQRGLVIFSPISHSHPIADHMDEKLRTSQEFWMKQDTPLVKASSNLFMIIITGEEKDGMTLIKESKGCQQELKIAKENNVPVTYIII